MFEILNPHILLLTACIFGISPALASLPQQVSTFPLTLKEIQDPTSDCDIFFGYIYNLTVNQSNATIPSGAPVNLTQDVNYFAEYSGHSFNDVGFYDICRSITPARNYLFMEMTSRSLNTPDGSSGLYVGLCLPSYCTKDYLEAQAQQILDVLSLFKVHGIDQFDIVYVDPTDYTINKGFWLVFTIIVFTAIVLLNIAGSIITPYIEGVQVIILRPSSESSSKISTDPLAINQTSFKDSSFKDSAMDNEGLLFRQSVEEGSLPLKRKAFKEKVAGFFGKRRTLLRVLKCFNLSKNLEALFKDEKDAKMDQSLNVLDGLRGLAFFGIVYCHTFLNSAVSKNEFSTLQFGKTPGMLIALAAFFGVDVFFLLSGFLQGFQLTSKLKRMPLSIKSYLSLIRHRWLRLIPAYFIAILFYWNIAVHIGDGPIWYQYVNRAQQCSDSWWKNVLFLDNVLNTGSKYYCFNWGWYLACDFQMFLFAPFICWIFLKNRIRAYNLLWFLCLVTFVAGFWGATDVNFKYSVPPAQSTGNFWVSFYSNTFVRMSSYLIGIFIGTQYRNFKQSEKTNLFAQLKQNTKAAYLCSFLGLSALLFVILFPRTVQTGTVWSDGFNYFWQVMDRPILASGLFFFVAPTIVGHIKPLKAFLGSYFFLIVSRLSYCGYLIQLMVILICYKSQSVFLGFSYEGKNNLVIAFIMVSVVAAGVMHLLIEKPATNLELEFMNHNPKRSILAESKPTKAQKSSVVRLDSPTKEV